VGEFELSVDAVIHHAALKHSVIDQGGISHHIGTMSNALTKKKKLAVRVIDQYDVVADAKKRISLRKSQAKHYRVRVLSDGSFLLEPQALVPVQLISARTLKMLDQSARNLKKGVASPPIDLSQFPAD
jgi:hypothetical protein